MATLLAKMRKRWRSQYRGGADPTDDVPSSLPVFIPGEENLRDDGDNSLAGEFEPVEELGSSALERLFGHGSDDVFQLPTDAVSEPLEPELESDMGAVEFVDTGDASGSSDRPLSHVGRAAPDTVISGAIRLTDKK